MRLDAMIAEVRPRNHWEAMDLGWVLARKHYPALFKAWVIMVWPVWAVILFACRAEPFWGLALIWWLKPLAERVPLLVLSREMFGESLTVGLMWRKWPRVWFRHLFADLVMTRLSPSRHVLLPVRQLEELRGKAFAQRAARLTGRCGAAPWLLQVLHLVLLHSLSFSMFLFVAAMIPERYAPEWDLFFSGEWEGETFPMLVLWGWTILYAISLSLVTPLCVAAGFGLYLNARTKMEGWDIEIAFRKLAARIGASALAVALLIGTVQPARAADDGWNPQTATEEILAKPEFKIHTRIEYHKVPKTDDLNYPDWFDLHLPDWFGWLGGFGGIPAAPIANAITYLLIGLAVGIVAVLIGKWILAIPKGGKSPVKTAVVSTVMGMNVRQDSLPKDIVAAARKLLAEGDFDGAMALLYRGALVWLIHRGQVPIQEIDTEADCVARVRQLEGVSADYFEQLTRIWSAAAYGARRAGAAEIERLLEAWPYHANRKEAA